MEAALAFVVSAAETNGNGNDGGNNDDNGYEAKAVHELLEWRKRLGEETKDLDPGGALDGKRGWCIAPLKLASVGSYKFPPLFL